MHRSNRTISDENAVIIEDMLSSGIGATDAYRYMAQEAGGEDMIGYTKRDCLNYVNMLKILTIEGGDAQTLLNILEDQSAENDDFFYRVRLDEDGRLSHVFWRDSMMKDDFTIFGDVMVFDTTYRTNKYNLICAPFVGLNNYKKNVMFGCAFLSNEKIETFVWLFETFKKSMGGPSPISLFTDQDLAMSKAIEKVFPQTRHRLCIWHLHQNAQSHLGKLKSDKTFYDAFQRCITGCIDSYDFEECWKAIVENHNLQNNSWIQRLYELREKWSNAFNKEYFSAGILSSQRSESTNHALGFKAKKTTNLTEFYGLFKQTIKRWRSNELSDEFQCIRGQPTTALPMTGIIKQASKVYNLTVFKDFEKQFMRCLAGSFSFLSEEYDFKLYQVKDGQHTYQVSFYNVMNTLVTCTCNLFEECGMLCSHCLRILLTHSIDKIPDCYINKRWTKLAKQALWDKNVEQQSKSAQPWKHQFVKNCLNLALQVQDNENARRLVEDGLEYIRLAALQEMENTMSETNEAQDLEACSESSISVKDPKKSVTKGRKQRIKGHLEKNTKKKRKNVDESNLQKPNEFGSKTPNQHLF
ncbi:protein FAR1-RELATED SEQUENCE 5-like [Salvia miltiorrhiza]|uniref:protein FAR1-RELATED SEQUENCE 5-like n=1 Tax=Salvia miltiorrhiza TaxID=226208 RepID=UPI0025ABA545|nr:protein FAR1-RELATED SEQUENCE 5-like [Salvia miltiorrhiza]